MQRPLLATFVILTGCYASHQLGEPGGGGGGVPTPGVPGVPRDVDGDGRADLLVAAMNPARAYVYSGTSDGLSTRPIVTLGGRDYIGQLAFAGDLDHDGYAEVALDSVVVDDGVRHVEIFRGGRSGPSTHSSMELSPPDGFTFPFPYATGDHGIVSADVDGDGWQDLVVASLRADPRTATPESNAISVYLGRDDGVLPSTPSYVAVAPSVTGDPLPAARWLAWIENLGDVDGDGREDVALVRPDYERSYALVYLGAPGGAWAEPIQLHVPESWAGAAPVGDVDGDGFDDVTVGTWLFHGGGAPHAFERSEPFGLHGEFSRLVDWSPAGDVDADGYDDVVSFEIDTTGLAYVALHLGSRSGVDATSVAHVEATYEIPPDTTGTVVTHPVGDVDADGLADYVVAIPNMGELHVVRGGASHDAWSQTIAAPDGHHDGYSYFGYLLD